ncbi:MAG: enoyl-CoA hydratase/isomerase family protein [Cryobacterium sp.]|nr:enoyl-CoA hydratase/isomerase family protein [Micrococcales bacterium]MBX3079231.1 enoyl-CoA hydratase/isomerase family protein [Cryobacterium sp.]
MGIEVTEPQPGVRLLTIDRPGTKNALDIEAYSALTSGLRDADSDGSVHAIIVTGAGGTFSSGNDLEDFRRYSDPTPARDFLRTLVLIGTPLIAAVEGAAVGIGATMLLHCDLVVAARSATFRMPFVPLGLTPEGGSTHLLPKAAGAKLAAELLLFGDAFAADVAERAGMVNRVVPDGEALPSALRLAERLCGLPSEALREAHKLLHRDRDQLLAVIDDEIAVFRERLESPEAQAILNSMGGSTDRG